MFWKFLTVLVCLCLSVQLVHAVDLEFSTPEQISDSTFIISVKISGASTGKNYLRVDIFKEGTTNYFGETFNGSGWVNSSNGVEYFPINIESGVDALATISARVGNTSPNDYQGPGQYQLRVRRYTQSGNAAGDQVASKPVTLLLAASTPVVSPTSVPSATRVPTIKPSPTNAVTIKEEESEDDIEKEVLGEHDLPEDNSSETDENNPKKNMDNKSNQNSENSKSEKDLIPLIFLISGSILLVLCGILLFRRKKKYG